MLDNDFEEMQNLYMKMHERDYDSNIGDWDQTLYIPLRKYILSIIQTYFKKEKIDFFYIGCGPRSPLFQDIKLSQFLESRFRSLTLLDISENALESSYQKLKSIFKTIPISKIRMDITNGYSKYFAELVTQQIQSFDKNSSHDHFSFNQRQLNVTRDFIENSVPPLQGHFCYSEMVATFTGTAIMLELEKEFNQLRENPDFTAEILENHIGKAYESWKEFNYHSFYVQTNNIMNFTRENGILATACDTEKVFDNPELKSIPSFPDSQNVIWQNLPLKEMKDLQPPTILWRDYPTTQQGHVTALEPHQHQVKFFTLQKKGLAYAPIDKPDEAVVQSPLIARER